MELKDWLNINRGVFEERDLRFLIKDILPGNFYHFWEGVPLSKDRLDYLEKVKKLYKRGVPLPYILGKEEFFGWKFKVNPCALIPRKETELIVEAAAEIIKKNNVKFILDLGCGCGNIAISLKKLFGRKVVVLSSDKSFAALGVAKENMRLHKVDIKLINNNLLEGFKNNCFDMVISNPPYVESSCIKGSLSYEPRMALEASEGGVSLIKEIIFKARYYLKKEGYLVLEIGYNHRNTVENLVRHLNYEIIEWIKDYSGYWRGIILKKVESRGK
jgi:release factor glutamine methyltransferase